MKDIWKSLPGVDALPLLWEMIVDQWNAVKKMVFDLQPSTPSNKPQKFIRSALALFSNLSSLFIYLVLIFIALKTLVLSIAKSEGALDRVVSSIGPQFITFPLVVILLVLVSVRVLLSISKFIKSYRIMTIIGIITVVTSLVKASVQLVMAESVSGMWETLGQFLLGAFK